MSRLLPSKRDICKHLFRQIIDIFSIDLEPKINTADGTLTPFSQKWFRLKCTWFVIFLGTVEEEQE